MSVSPVQFRAVVEAGDLAALESEWRRLFARGGSADPFLSWEWNWTWYQEFASEVRPSFAVFEHNGEVVAIAPLRGRRRRFRSQLDDQLADYGEMLVDTQALSSLDTLLQALITGQHLQQWVIGPVRGLSPIRPLLEAQLGTPRWFRRELGSNPRVRIEGGFDAYLASRSKKLRQEIRTTVNHLERGGEWSFSEETQGNAARSIYDALVGFHRARQDAKPGTSVFDNERNRRYLRDIIGALEPAVQTHLSALHWQGRIVSAAYSLRCGPTLYYWTPSFDPALRSLSLGKLHIAQLIRRCHDTGLHWFDFMGGSEAYKLQWANDLPMNYEYWAFANPARRWRARARLQLRDWFRDRKSRSPLIQGLWQRWSKLSARS